MSDWVLFLAYAPVTFVTNLLFEANIPIKRVQRVKGGVQFLVTLAKKDEVEKRLTARNVGYEVEKMWGTKTTWRARKTRFGLMVGLCLAVGLLALYSQLLTAPVVTGLSHVQEEIVLQALAEEGATFPTFHSRIDTKTLTHKVLGIEGVSQAFVGIRGTRLIVNIEEQLPEPDKVDTQTPVPFVATVSGVVKSVVVLAGTPLIKKGDIIKEGQVLIAPYMLGAAGEENPVRAMGEVVVEAHLQRHTYFANEGLAFVRTGNEEQKVALEVLGMQYEPKTSFLNHEVVCTRRQVGGVFPFWTTTYTFFETEERWVPFDFENRQNELKEREFAALLEEHGEGLSGGTPQFVIKKLDNATLLSIYYTVDMCLSS